MPFDAKTMDSALDKLRTSASALTLVRQDEAADQLWHARLKLLTIKVEVEQSDNSAELYRKIFVFGEGHRHYFAVALDGIAQFATLHKRDGPRANETTAGMILGTAARLQSRIFLDFFKKRQLPDDERCVEATLLELYLSVSAAKIQLISAKANKHITHQLQLTAVEIEKIVDKVAESDGAWEVVEAEHPPLGQQVADVAASVAKIDLDDQTETQIKALAESAALMAINVNRRISNALEQLSERSRSPNELSHTSRTRYRHGRPDYSSAGFSSDSD